MNKEGNELNPVAMALAAYLQNYEPAQDGMDMLLKTTEAIERDLQDMAEPQPGEVAAMMAQAGYSIIYQPDGRHGWAMRARRE